MEYCNAFIGSSRKMSAESFAMVSTGNASGAGFPAAKLITSGSAVNLSISRIAEGCKPDTRSENGFNI